MPGLIPYRTLASVSKGHKTGIADGRVLPKPDITREDLVLIPEGKIVDKVYQLQEVHSLSFTAMDPKVATEQLLVHRAKGRGCMSTSRVIYSDDYSRHDESSGSEHEPNSVCLAAMVDEFIEEAAVDGKCGRARCNCQIGTCDGAVEPSREDDNEDSKSALEGELLKNLQGLVLCTTEVEQKLLSDVKKAVKLVSEQENQMCEVEGVECIKGCVKRAVMQNLREAGYNAAICKSKFDHSGGFPAGDYKYIDVLMEDPTGKGLRLIVDTEFRWQFEIARPTDQYDSTLQEMPLIFVGKQERLQQIVSLMSVAVKASLRKRRMSLPPWRSPKYMQAKWFSPYKRTTNVAFCHQRARASHFSGELAHTALQCLDWDSKFTTKLDANQTVKLDSKNKKGMLRFDQLRIGSIPVDERGLTREAWAANKSRIYPDQITVVSTDWQPPSVSFKSSKNVQKVALLASILKEAGLTLTKPLPNPQKVGIY